MHIASARFRFTSFSLVQNPLRGVSRATPTRVSRYAIISTTAESRVRALSRPRDHAYGPVALQRGENMELLQLEPPNYGVHSSGIYIIDDDGIGVLAGPFQSERTAMEWINERQEIVNQNRLAAE